ncbi:hypothetical protein PR048_004228 [Dryococelus australis]|uniref:DUF4371 domain-containing protein n=1 Tax=Dryococelus australis TaxID=614101 RepID=A0ABQ9I624_9NEOP|nr:hypothetical protein PR048_004228 [Dryococelus australis]
MYTSPKIQNQIIDICGDIIKEHIDFLSFTPLKDLTGQGIAETIIAALKHHGIHDEYLIGQGYDGASSISGYLHGAQAYVRKGHSMALYVNCSTHYLNLALAEPCSLYWYNAVSWFIL